MSKGNILPSSFVMGALVFGLFITAGISILTDFWMANPSVDGSQISSFNKTFDTYSKAKTETDTLTQQFTSSEADTSVFGMLNALITVSWGVIKSVFSSFSFMFSTIYGITSFFGVPLWITNSIMALVSVGLVFAVISAILQRDV
jgi:hypothetical protein